MAWPLSPDSTATGQAPSHRFRYGRPVELRKLPKVDRVADAPELTEVRRALGSKAVTALARAAIAEARSAIRAGAESASFEQVVSWVKARAEARLLAGILPVINGTGVILHTNLGRAPLPQGSLDRIARTAGGYSTLELDLETGVRTRRGVQVERGLAELVGAGDVALVNNNAAAVMLALSSIAAGREVIVSRGELVEIGGGFRIPEVLARSGARLVEVGTTNRTRVDDYARAIGEHTACLLRVHPSNFKITGFAERPGLVELTRLAKSRGIPLIKDLGGGLVVGLPSAVAGSELAREPSVQACLVAGVDLVCFSLDKLFGGPQGGAVAGRADLVSTLREDPMARALRLDKLALAAVEGVLDAYQRGALDEIPVHALLAASTEALCRRVDAWVELLHEQGVAAERVNSEAAIGGGTLAEAPVSSVALRISGTDPDQLAQRLRSGSPALIGRVVEGALLVDARSVFPEQDPLVAQALRRACGN